MTKPRARAAALAVFASVALAACGGGEKGDAEELVREAADAFAEKDGKRYCGLLTSSAKRDLGGEQSCANAIEAAAALLPASDREALAELEIEDVELDGDAGTVKVAANDGLAALGGRREVRVRKEGGEWRLDG